jgi:ligand-binding SRPBCC domain-containing protein
MPLLEVSISIRCRIDEIFDFLTVTENLPKIVPPDLGLRLVQAPQQFSLGSQFEVQILGFGPPQNVSYEITEFSRPQGFTEVQTKGPLKRYLHQHVLSAEDGETVLVSDRIEFEPPGGFLGFLMTADRIQKSLHEGLSHRHRELKRLLEGT